jgi:hypothetical protein
MGGFRLSKWYLDVVREDGALVIAYAARLELAGLGIDYASLLACDAGGTVTTRSSLRRAAEPQRDGEAFVWSAPSLAFAARAVARDPAVEATLLDGELGKLVWSCHAPAAEVSASIDGRAFAGLGYVERVELTVPPWKLPIRELRWGRALSATDALVWIDWRGDAHAVKLAARRGVVRPGDFVVDHDGVRDATGAALVRLTDHVTLRRGAIGDTALAILGRDLRSRFPGKALLLDEHKERSRAELASGEQGFAIHEVVRFP